MFDGNNLLHDESLLKQNKTRQKARLRKRFEDKFKIIQSGGFLVSLLSETAGRLMKVKIPTSKDILAPI